MATLNEGYLRSFGSVAYKASRIVESVQLARSDEGATIFISHSHKDRDLINGLINYLSQYSTCSLYVDWQDSLLPRETSAETARAVKHMISRLDKFIVLATVNALESRWVPWELGVADATKDFNDILVVPVDDDTGRFVGNEYIAAYNRLDLQASRDPHTPSPRVVPPQENTISTIIGASLTNWLTP